LTFKQCFLLFDSDSDDDLIVISMKTDKTETIT
jgi:hypothetical protein